MRRNSGYEQIIAPGLPTWPRLLFDRQRNRAVVSFRVANWRSWDWAQSASVPLAISFCVALGGWLWQQLATVGDPVVRVGLCVFGGLLAFGMLSPFLATVVSGFLARQVFAARVTVWFTPEAIAFRSRLYDNGVVVWRNWKQHPIQTRFDLAPDPEAADRRVNVAQEKAALRPRLQTARILRLVLSAFDPTRRVTQSTQTNIARAIPLLEVDLADAQRLTVVLAAAAELTAGGGVPAGTASSFFPTAQPVTRQETGVDIDAS